MEDSDFAFLLLVSCRMDLKLSRNIADILSFFTSQAFPETAWAFVFRQPVQTMMSHLDPKKGTNAAPCLRSKRAPPTEVRIVKFNISKLQLNCDVHQVSNAIDKIKGSLRGKTPNEAWCAAHLNMLCSSALRAYEKYPTMQVKGEARQRGLLINYDSLPGSIPSALLPLFNVPLTQSWLEKMNEESNQYSKSRTGHKSFTGDSADKDNRATEQIQEFAQSILGETYDTLNEKALDGFKNLLPELHSVWDGGIDKPANWASIKTLMTDVRHVIHD